MASTEGHRKALGVRVRCISAVLQKEYPGVQCEGASRAYLRAQHTQLFVLGHGLTLGKNKAINLFAVSSVIGTDAGAFASRVRFMRDPRSASVSSRMKPW
jgi:hypothetical protein